MHDVTAERLAPSTTLDETSDRGLVALSRGDGAVAADARRLLTERYQPLVIGMAGRLHLSRGADHDDVVANGQVGLQKAIRDFDLTREAPFPAYARAKVHGELMRGFRDDRYAIHVPRTLHERAMQIRRVSLDIEARQGATPTVDEIAATMGLDAEHVIEALAVSSAERGRVGELTSIVGKGRVQRRRDPDIAAALLELDPTIRRVLHGQFVMGYSQAALGEAMGISQAHVSRLFGRGVDALREALGDTHDPAR